MELTHVDLDERVVIAEQEVRQRLGQLGLADAGRAGEDERPRRALGVLQPGARAADRLGDRLNGILLADDPLVQLVLHAEQTRRLLLGQLEDRDAGPVTEDLGDLLVVDLGHDVHMSPLRHCFSRSARCATSCFSLSRRLAAFEVLGVDRRFLLLARLGDAIVELAQVWRRGHPADAHARAPPRR